MKNKFKYIVKLIDPKMILENLGGGVSFTPKHINGDKDKSLSKAELIAHDRQRVGFYDLDFNTPYDRKTVFRFKIINDDDDTKWEFRDPPFTVNDMSAVTRCKRNKKNKRKAVLVVKGHGSHSDTQELKYTLHYQEKGNPKNTFDHDPVIRNGTIPPS